MCCTYLGCLVAELHHGKVLGVAEVAEERRQLVGEVRVLANELPYVVGHLVRRQSPCCTSSVTLLYVVSHLVVRRRSPRCTSSVTSLYVVGHLARRAV